MEKILKSDAKFRYMMLDRMRSDCEYYLGNGNRYAELLKAGRIELDDVSGHAGLTSFILELAERFEKEHAGVDWNSDTRDYWVEIDAFAERELLEQYRCERDSREQESLTPELSIKVIVSDGVVEGALKNVDVPVSVEIVDIDEFYDDYEERKAYREKLYKDVSLIPCDCAFTNQKNMDTVSLPEDPVKVYAVAGSVKNAIFSGNLDECKAFCEENRWSWFDENRFQWDLEIEDSRDNLLPEDYFDALDYYSDTVGRDIENEFVRQHAEELVYCYHNEKEIVAFDFWTQYEVLLGEKITFEEYLYIDQTYDGDPMDLKADDPEVRIVQNSLGQFRATAPAPLEDRIKEAAEKISAAHSPEKDGSEFER